MKSYLVLPYLAWLASTVYAHSIFQELYVNGVSQGHLQGIRVPDYDGPIMDVNSDDIICNGGINPYHQPVSQKIITVAAGTQVTAEWHHTLDGANPKVFPRHKTPIPILFLNYRAQVDSATQSNVTGLKWFKVYHDGYTNGIWGVDRLIQNKGKVSFSIPSCIPDGQYLLRVEIIALHAAESYPGAQFYMECAQLQITSGGSTSPATVNFPGAYHGSDPGITVNIYANLSGYIIPGPPVLNCDASGGGSSSTVTSRTTGPTTTTATTTTTAPTGAGSVAQYGQCGGIGWTGDTVCVAPYTCKKLNDYYSQCL
ncbi:hypothetical protein Ac2012v2_005716 [Leucoagaricus gongylophorus]